MVDGIIQPHVYMGMDQSRGGFGLTFLVPSHDFHETKVGKFPLAKFGGQNGLQLYAIEDWLISSMNKYQGRIKSVAMEGYAHDAKFGREKAGELGWAVKRTLIDWLPSPICFPTIVAIPRVKEFATGKGKASKEEMVDAVRKIWGIDFGKDHDAAESFVNAKIAYALDGGDTRSPYQEQVVAKIRESEAEES